MDLKTKIDMLIKNKDWDKFIYQNNDILSDLLFEYISTLSEISGLTEDFILNKLNDQLEVLRFGDFGFNDNFLYDGVLVNSDFFRNKYRNNGFGAITVDTDNGKRAVCLFDGSGKYSGIDLTNIEDIKHTLYHELTHVLERSLVKNNGIIFNQDGNYIVTGNCNPFKDFRQYIIDSKNLEIYTNGLVTHEFNKGEKFYHNEISEGCTEMIARMILEKNNIPILNPNRYIENVTMAKMLFDNYGDNFLKDYFTDSSKIINTFVNDKINGKNLLAYADEFREKCGKVVGSARNNGVNVSSSDVDDFYEYLRGKKTLDEVLNGKSGDLVSIIHDLSDYKEDLDYHFVYKKAEKFLYSKINVKELVSQYLDVFKYILKMYKNNGDDLYSIASSYIDASMNGKMYKLNTKLNIDQVKEIAFDFFSKLDCGSEIIQSIESDIKKNRIYFDNNDPRCIASFDGSWHELFLTNYGDLRDLYTVAHEYTHAFDSLDGVNKTRRLMTETNSQCMERLLDSYLLSLSFEDLNKYGIDKNVLEKDILDRNIATFCNRFKLVDRILKNENDVKSVGYIFALIYSDEFSKLSFDEQKVLLNSMINNTRNDKLEQYLSSMPCDLTINNSSRNQILFSNLKEVIDKLFISNNLENNGRHML